MAKLKRSNKKFGRCSVHGQGCEVCSEIRSNYINRKTDVSIHMGFEKRLLDDDDFREWWIRNEIDSSVEYSIEAVSENS